jgi:hypothetical protein
VRSLSVCVIALVAAVLVVAQPVAALPILQVPYVRAGPVWYLNPSQIADLVVIEANTSHLAASDNEALAISFVPNGGGTSGVLSIAPVIAQTSSRTILCDQSYFYEDFSVL